MDFNLTPVLSCDENSEDFITENYPEIIVHLNIPIQNENKEERIILLKRGANCIGRDKSCDVIIDNQVLSRYHAVIEVDKYSCLIYDVGSRNKTWKGKMLLKPNIRYNLENKESIRLANLKAFIAIDDANEECFSALSKEAEKSVVEDEESETGSESMITNGKKCYTVEEDIDADMTFVNEKGIDNQQLNTVFRNEKENTDEKTLTDQSVLPHERANQSDNDITREEILINASTEHFESHVNSDEDTSMDDKLMNAPTQCYESRLKSDDNNDETDDERLMNAPTQCYESCLKSNDDDDDDETDDEKLMNAPTQCYNNHPVSDDDITDDEKLMNAPTQHYSDRPNFDDDISDDKLINAPTQKFDTSSDDSSNDESLLKDPNQNILNRDASHNYTNFTSNNVSSNLLNEETGNISQSTSADEDLLNVETRAYLNDFIDKVEDDLANNETCNREDKELSEDSKVDRDGKYDEIIDAETLAYSSNIEPNIDDKFSIDKETCELANKTEGIESEEKRLDSILKSRENLASISPDCDTKDQNLKTPLINIQQSKFLMEETLADFSLNDILCMSTQPQESQTDDLDYECDYLAETQEIESSKTYLDNIESTNLDDSEIPPVPDDYVAETPPHLLDLSLSESEEEMLEKSKLLAESSNKSKDFDKSENISGRIYNEITETNNSNLEDNLIEISKVEKCENLGHKEEEKVSVKENVKNNSSLAEERNYLNKNEGSNLNNDSSNNNLILERDSFQKLEKNQIEETNYCCLEQRDTPRNQVTIPEINKSVVSQNNNLIKTLTNEKGDASLMEKNSSDLNKVAENNEIVTSDVIQKEIIDINEGTARSFTEESNKNKAEKENSNPSKINQIIIKGNNNSQSDTKNNSSTAWVENKQTKSAVTEENEDFLNEKNYKTIKEPAKTRPKRKNNLLQKEKTPAESESAKTGKGEKKSRLTEKPKLRKIEENDAAEEIKQNDSVQKRKEHLSKDEEKIIEDSNMEEINKFDAKKPMQTRNRSKTDQLQKEKDSTIKRTVIGKECQSISKKKNTRSRKNIKLLEKESTIETRETIIEGGNSTVDNNKNLGEAKFDEFINEKEDLNTSSLKTVKNEVVNVEIKEKNSTNNSESNTNTEEIDDLRQSPKTISDSPGLKLEICVGKLKEISKKQTSRPLKQENIVDKEAASHENKKSSRKQKRTSKIAEKVEERRQSPRKRKLIKDNAENTKETDFTIAHSPVMEGEKRKSPKIAKTENKIGSLCKESDKTGDDHDTNCTVTSEKTRKKIPNKISAKDSLDSSSSAKSESSSFEDSLNQCTPLRKSERSQKKKEHPEFQVYPMKKSTRSGSADCTPPEKLFNKLQKGKDESTNNRRTRRGSSITEIKNLEKSPKTALEFGDPEQIKHRDVSKLNEHLSNGDSSKNSPIKTKRKQTIPTLDRDNVANISTRKRKAKSETAGKVDTSPKLTKRRPLSNCSSSSTSQNGAWNLTSPSPKKQTCANTRKQNLNSSSKAKSKKSKFKIMFTGMNESGIQKIVTKLGGEIVDDPKLCTHLVTDKFHRTVKMMCCVAKGIPVVVSEWLRRCESDDAFVDHAEYLLKDSRAEKQYKFNLKETLDKAQRTPLLKGWSIHATNKVKPVPEQMKDIIEFAGGKYVSRMPTRFSDRLLIVSCPEDLKTCGHAAKCGIPVVGTEYLLTGLLRHRNEVEAYPFCTRVPRFGLSL
ncbi:putative leucine-rich repeat-containing protein DDB_G0290503 isoform X2 [Centruroides vittatus]|uniref:putative leucine-rich repeat-containing protein DDB_G0290503 isoform X2 n=1 Tax=Centruroides vittatus TaxID=120091 RepID=UPI00351014F9